MGGHLDKLGRSLTAAVSSYNRAVGSLETRVLVSARRFAEMAVTDEELTAPGTVTDATRPLSAPELMEAVAEEREELPHLIAGDTRSRPARGA
jgi:DNA recombination protein RmuC